MGIKTEVINSGEKSISVPVSFKSEMVSKAFVPPSRGIYRRDFYSGTGIVKKLMSETGEKLFNFLEFTKYDLYKIINEMDSLKDYLPPTALVEDFYSVISFIEEHDKVILKPVDISGGRGICIIDKKEESFKVKDCRKRESSEILLLGVEEFEKFFNEEINCINNYIVQKYIKLARIEYSVYDIRVVMQKGKENKWNCSGIECRVGKTNFLLTNVYKSEYSLSLVEALKKSFPIGCNYEKIMEEINELCLNICNALDKAGEHFLEFGMDIAIDEDKKLWLIEVNALPGFKGFKVMDYNTYLSIRYSPLLYAASQEGFKGD